MTLLGHNELMDPRSFSLFYTVTTSFTQSHSESMCFVHTKDNYAFESLKPAGV